MAAGSILGNVRGFALVCWFHDSALVVALTFCLTRARPSPLCIPMTAGVLGCPFDELREPFDMVGVGGRSAYFRETALVTLAGSRGDYTLDITLHDSKTGAAIGREPAPGGQPAAVAAGSGRVEPDADGLRFSRRQTAVLRRLNYACELPRGIAERLSAVRSGAGECAAHIV